MMGMPRFRRRGGKEEGGTLLGILLGLALGAILAFGIAWWFTRNAPFPAQTPTDKNQGSPGGTAPTETKFDFYKVLPEGWNGNDGKTQKPAEPPKAAETKTPPQPATVVPTPPVTPQVAAIAPEPPKPQGTERLYWQIGAFATEKEASRVRAELAMAGITSTVEPARMPDGRTLYRVRAGPYRSQDEAQAARARLLAAGYAPTLVK
ncbi:MAG: hypothetical protein PWQ19_1541 [Tepidiphilus sp.]|nr:hypothetical protein [Tepidiphilus sp.]